MVVLIIGTGGRERNILNHNLLLRIARFEVQLGIIAACIPTLRPAYRWSKGKIANLRGHPSTYIVECTEYPAHLRAPVPQPRDQWTEICGEEVALPEFSYYQKTTHVGMDSRDDLEFNTNSKWSHETRERFDRASGASGASDLHDWERYIGRAS